MGGGGHILQQKKYDNLSYANFVLFKWWLKYV